MKKQDVTSSFLIERKIKDINDFYDLDIKKIIARLFPLKNIPDSLELVECQIMAISENQNFIYLNLDVFDLKYVTNCNLVINLSTLELELHYDSDYMDVYKILNNEPLLEKRVYKRTKNGLKVTKKYTKKGNPYLKRKIGELSYHTYQYIFEQQGFKAIIRFNLEDDKTFQEEAFIERLLNLEVIVTNIKELRSIICVLSSLGEIPNNEGFFEVLEVTPKKEKSKVKKKG